MEAEKESGFRQKLLMANFTLKVKYEDHIISIRPLNPKAAEDNLYKYAIMKQFRGTICSSVPFSEQLKEKIEKL